MSALESGKKFFKYMVVCGACLTVVNTLSAPDGNAVDAFLTNLIGFTGISIIAFVAGAAYGGICNLFQKEEQSLESNTDQG